MAYDATKDDDRPETDEHRPSRGGAEPNPYASLAQEPLTPGLASPGSVQTSAGPELMDAGGPTATGHVNFDQVYNANAGVAQREARNRSSAAEKAAKGVQSGITGAQQQFQSGVTGAASSGPSADDFARAGGGGTPFYQAPPRAAAQLPDTAAAEGGESSIAPDWDSEAHWRTRMQAGANRGYSGPGSLSDLDAYKDLLKGATKSDETVDALQSNEGLQATGLNETDAALLGAAGRPEFARLDREYSGEAKKLGEANLASKEVGDRAKQDALSAQERYRLLLNADDARGDAELGAPQESDAAGSGWHPNGAGSFSDFMNAGGVDAAGLHNAGRALDPLDQLTKWLGEEGVYQGKGATDTFASTFGQQYGAPGDADQHTANVRNAFGDISKAYGNEGSQWLFDHMTEEEWNSYSGMNSGAVLRLLRQKLEAAIRAGEFTPSAPGSQGGRASEVHSTNPTSDEDEEAIIHELASGRPYTDASGKTWTSLTDWYAAHPPNS